MSEPSSSDPKPESSPSESSAKTPEPGPKPTSGSPMGTLVGVLGFVVTLAGGFYGGRYISEKYDVNPIRWFKQTFMGEPAAELPDGERIRVGLRGDEPQRGPDDALVTIIEFSDFQCPYCAKAVEPLDDAVDDFEGDVRVIFKHYPLPGHQKALPAAKLAWAAGQQGKFWEVHNWLFEHKASTEGLDAFAESLGLDVAKLKADAESQAAADAVDSDHLSGGKAGASGTPYFVVNGHRYSGTRSAGQWRTIIKHERRAAEALIDDGTARGEVYSALMKDAVDVYGDGTPIGGAPSKRGARRPGEPAPDLHYRVPADDRPARGPADALVTIVAFSDFQCPFCKKVNVTLDAVREVYGDDLRVVFRNRPLNFHPQARPAAKAALAAAKQGKFWEMHDALFDKQQELKGALYAEIAGELGLDVAQFEADFANPELEQMISEDERLAAAFGANGTPAFFINGRFLSGAQPIDAFKSTIDEELEDAKAMVAAGTPRDQVFSAVMAEAATEVAK